MNPAYRPMLATLVDEPFDDKRWVFEAKWDSVRVLRLQAGLILSILCDSTLVVVHVQTCFPCNRGGFQIAER